MTKSTLTKIKFINHASVQINSGGISLLSDPWYFGDAFHKGWNLLTEQDDDEIIQLISEVTHIWLSHEHPDHFSIGFFKKYKNQLQKKNVIILFQETKDNRVKSFFVQSGFIFQELKFEQPIFIGQNFEITCIKDGFYDSALFVKTADQRILNLNDCVINSKKRLNQIRRITGDCDILLSQFSYAAWKGGEKNLPWRLQAAKDKLNIFYDQSKKFNAKFVIPFASFVYFSNDFNKYLNDSVNRPNDVAKKLQDINTDVLIMKPFDSFDGTFSRIRSENANQYWEDKFNSVIKLKTNSYNQIALDDLRQLFISYKDRVFQNNNFYFVRFVKMISPIKIFMPIVVKLNDINETVVIDLLSESLKTSNKKPDLIMSSESLEFIFKNTFGFDTLSVNGCFEEGSKNAFTKSVKSLAIENLNNIGISFKPPIFLNMKIILIFLKRLQEVQKIIEKTSYEKI